MKIKLAEFKKISYRNGWNQEEFAKKLHVDRSTVNKIFNGHREIGIKVLKGLYRLCSEEEFRALCYGPDEEGKQES